MSEGIALRLSGVSKRYPGTLAVNCVDMEVHYGEVHALMGENGAGKSTLMNIIAGSFGDYTGEIEVDGKPANLHSPAQAKEHGIEMIHQELNLSLPQSIAENIFAGRLPVKLWVLNKKRLHEEAKRYLDRVSLDVDPGTPIERIGQHEAQLVEIAKALASNPRILVMDEPTSALTRQDVERLFELIANLKKQGLAIIYISHHLSEIFEIADRVTVMRDGKKVATKPIGETTPEDLVEMMVGKSVVVSAVERSAKPGDVKLKVNKLTRRGFFLDCSFEIRRAEIVGICGLMGSGSTELARSICGIDPIHEGSIELDGQAVNGRNMQDALSRNMAYLTEDRKQEGLALRLNISDNVLSALIPRHSIFGVYNQGQGRRMVPGMLKDLAVSPPIPSQIVGNLSGGNQQKVLLAKWLAIEPEFLALDEPTRGVDIGAKVVIHDAIAKLADEGKAVLVISSDLPELIALCDRILIMKDGRLIGDVPKAEATEKRLLLAANGAEAVA